MNPISILTFCLLILLYVWICYNTPILAVGVKHMLRLNKEKKKSVKKDSSLPKVSIVVPVKDEERVIGRLLEALLKLDYPPEKKEIIIVEDASNDRTPKICAEYARRHPGLIKFHHRSTSNGKPSALNYGFKYASGEIVAVFDADNVPEPDALLMGVSYFENPTVAAVQGTTCIINADENMLTKFISYEEAVWLKNYFQGKDVLRLFIPLTGSCQFIRRDVAEKIGLWDEDCLAEDLEMSARITERGYDIKYAPDVISWQEAPSRLSQLIRQRVRWFRGYMEVAIQYGRFLKRFERKTIDAEITLIGPYMLASFLLSYIVSIYLFMFPVFQGTLFLLMSRITLFLTTATLLIAGISLMYATKPRRFRNVLWLPFIYVYLNLQCILTFYALLQILFRRPRRWVKTPKTGSYTKASMGALSLQDSR